MPVFKLTQDNGFELMNWPYQVDLEPDTIIVRQRNISRTMATPSSRTSWAANDNYILQIPFLDWADENHITFATFESARPYTIYFRRLEDVTLFKLRWL